MPPSTVRVAPVTEEAFVAGKRGALIALQETMCSRGAWYLLRADDGLSPVRMMSAQRRSA
jgi:hypothetical protein